MIIPGFAMLFTTVGVSAKAQSFSINPLEPVLIEGQLFQTYAKAISSSLAGERVVVGYARDTIEGQGVSLPVRWSVHDGGLSDTSVLEFPSELFAGAVAVSVNSFGEIIGGGTFDNATGQGVGLYWTDDSYAPLIISGISGESHCQLIQINDDGIIAGISVNASGTQAVAWRIREDGTVAGPLVLPTRPRGATDDAALSVAPTKSGITMIAGSPAGPLYHGMFARRAAGI